MHCDTITKLRDTPLPKLLRESIDLECKLAVGRDGKGAVYFAPVEANEEFGPLSRISVRSSRNLAATAAAIAIITI